MEATFIELKIGDPVYFVTIEKSVIKDGTKINTATIIGKTNTLRPYETELTLSNSDKIFVNWNCDTHVEKDNNNPDLYDYGALLPISCKIYATNEKSLKEEISNTIEKKYNKLNFYQDKIKKQMLDLATMEMINNNLKIEKITELVSETVVI